MKVFLLVIDSFGIGALPDARDYGDVGSNTAAGIGKAVGSVKWPNLQNMGLGNIAELTGELIPGCPPSEKPTAAFGAMQEKSPGKDTTTGHWEMAGIVLEKAFPVFPGSFPSFPDELVNDFIRETGISGILGNKAASGTTIIEELGDEHLSSGKPICYTSADSVFQIAAHVDIYPIPELYKLCEIARKLCDPYNVGRVIARPFEGPSGGFSRTKDRHDWSIELPGKTLLDFLKDGGIETIAVGKIGSIFLEQGIVQSYHDAGNDACISRTLEIAREKSGNDRFIFVNLVDTDMIYGHRRDPLGYHDAVTVIDSMLPDLESSLNDGDLIVVTGDHGCDPTFKGTDHTREHVPVLVREVGTSGGAADLMNIGIRESFADLSVSLQKAFGKLPSGPGEPFILAK
jgi:phosphopentomutase